VKGHGQFPGSSITVSAHPVAKVREPDSAIAIRERELAAGSGVTEAGRSQHRL